MFAILLIVLGIGSRLITHTPQFTAILAVSMFAGLYLKPRYAMIVPVAMMIATDIILGFHDTMVYTWGSMLIISAVGIWIKSHKNFWTVFGGSILSAVIFFVITNLGAWISPLYPDTLKGLRECFIMAVPFFRSTLASTVAYSLVLYAGYEWLCNRSRGTSLARLF
jgi:hypothetical protein